MRTEIITKKIGTFDELTEEQQMAFIDKNRDWETQASYWYEFVFDGFQDKMDSYGIYANAADVRFSLSYSQDDGAAFKATVSDYSLFFEKVLAPHFTTQEILILENAQKWYPFKAYAHEGRGYGVGTQCGTLEIRWDGYTSEKLAKILDDLFTRADDFFDEWCKDQAHDIYITLRNEYEYQTSDECIRDTILLNEYEFDLETGEIYR